LDVYSDLFEEDHRYQAHRLDDAPEKTDSADLRTAEAAFLAKTSRESILRTCWNHTTPSTQRGDGAAERASLENLQGGGRRTPWKDAKHRSGTRKQPPWLLPVLTQDTPTFTAYSPTLFTTIFFVAARQRWWRI